MAAKDRRGEIIQSSVLNGIDFVEIAAPDQKTLRVHFLNHKVVLVGMVTKPRITGGETIPDVPVHAINDAADWSTDSDGNPVLTLRVDSPGDFSTYTLTLTSDLLDPIFASAKFSFKALCPSTLDCETPPPDCPPPAGDLPPIDYLAKDFESFRKALSDFSRLRYPEWQERSEADFGVMFLEALSSVGDDLSYTQDRVAAEATLDTATQRRSIVRHARLIDYEPRPATSAKVLLQFEVGGGPIPSGVLVSAAGPDGESIFFETGTGLADHTDYPAEAQWNNIAPYWFDDGERCLFRGSMDMFVEGHGLNLTSGQLLLIETQQATTADPPLRQIVQLNATPVELVDPIFGPTNVTHIFWRSEDAITADRDLTRTVVKGNLVPATEGRRYGESFAIQQATPATPQMPLAVFRTGANGAATYYYTLGNAPLAWLAPDDPSLPPLPEIVLVDTPSAAIPHPWTWLRSLLESDAFESAFTVDPVRFAPTATIPQLSPPQSIIMMDYDGDAGDTIRFGDGVFGDIPEDQTVFAVNYRSGGGAAGNVPADSITRIEVLTGLLISVNNPLPATGGADPEPAQTIRRLAPQAFRATQFRAVLQKDYEATAETLPWVQRAGTVFRWTGSWLTVFTTADPIGSEHIAVEQHVELIELLNRYRLAGYESYAPDPIYAALDLIITVCAQPDSFRGDVEAAVLNALSTRRFVDGTPGFFQFDNFTFGQPLERSALEAAIQEAHGVAGVLSIQFRRRGFTPGFVPMPDTVTVPVNQIILVENDPSLPERGSIVVIVKGGK
jgi:hypothetical protein